MAKDGAGPLPTRARAFIDRGMMGSMTEDTAQHIEHFRFPRGAVTAERHGRSHTLYHALSGVPVARLRPAGHEGSFEVLYWSAWTEKWANTGPFGRTVLPIDEARAFIAHENIFWVLC